MEGGDFKKQEQIFTGHPVRVPGFEGPLDLLFSLVKRSELEITEVSIASLADQYLEYIYLMAVLDVEEAGEFLATAATLAWMKSKYLLPRQEEEEEAEEEERDARELVDRLKEYSQYKQSADRLWEHYEQYRLMFPRGLSDGSGQGEVDLGEVSIFDLASAFREMLERAKPDPSLEPQGPRISVEEKMREILERLRRSAGDLALTELVGENPTRLFIIICFLAILELMKAEKITVLQPAPYAEITVRLAFRK